MNCRMLLINHACVCTQQGALPIPLHSCYCHQALKIETMTTLNMWLQALEEVAF